MKAFILNRKTVLAAFVMVAGLVFGLGSFDQEVSAVSDRQTQFGMISLSPGQSLRFNAVNVMMGDGSVRVTMQFDIYSLGGPDTAPGCSPNAVAACTNNLRWVRTETCRVNLRSRSAATCNISADQSGLVVSATLLVENVGSGANILPSIEVRENDRTIFVHPGVARGFDPQPEPPAGS